MLDSEGCQALHVALRDSLREGIGAIVCRSLLLLELFDCLRELGGLNAGAGDEVQSPPASLQHLQHQSPACTRASQLRSREVHPVGPTQPGVP